MNETHLPDGTIIATDTGEEIRRATDYRMTAARNYLATAPESDFSKLLADVMDVADDYMATDLDEIVTQVTYDGRVHLSPADVASLCPACLSRVTATL